jgi:ribosomal protein S18 acetylase RimI-like enzyme
MARSTKTEMSNDVNPDLTKRGVTRLQLLTERTNFQALAFYDKIGWESTKLICMRRKW